MPSLNSIVELQGQLVDLATLSYQDLAALWRRVKDNDDAEYIRDVLIELVPEIVGTYTNAAAVLTTQWYDDLLPETDFVAEPADPLDPAKLVASTRWALSPLFGGNASTSPLSLMGGFAQRAVFDASRQTVLLNANQEQGTRWARHASSNACEFCRMVATRGAVYTSESAANRVGGRGKSVSTNYRANGKRKAGGQAKGVRVRGTQKIGDKYHDHCHCVAVPVRPGDAYEPPPYVEQWEQQYIQAVRNTQGDGAISVKDVMAEMRRLAK